MLLDVRQHEVDGREVTLVGTRIVTPEALTEIAALVAERRPAEVVLDFDATRWRWIEMLKGNDEVDLVHIIRSGQMTELNARLAMGVLAKWLSPRTGLITEDAEFIIAHHAAQEAGCDIVFGRRPVDVEGLRAWRLCTLGGRLGFAWRLLKGSLRRTRLDETTDVAAFDANAARAGAVEHAGEAAPVLFGEAEAWLADVVRSRSEDLLVFTRACNLDAVVEALDRAAPTNGLEHVPEKSLFSRLIPWIFTGLIIAAFILGFVFADPAKMEQAMLAWFASNMSFAALGALLALAHPVTIIATSISAPFVSLNPAIGAGMVGALVQAFVAPPTVHDMDRVGDDITKISGWWRNRLARLVLIFVFGNVFSSIGSFAAFAWFPTS